MPILKKVVFLVDYLAFNFVVFFVLTKIKNPTQPISVQKALESVQTSKSLLFVFFVLILIAAVLYFLESQTINLAPFLNRTIFLPRLAIAKPPRGKITLAGTIKDQKGRAVRYGIISVFDSQKKMGHLLSTSQGKFNFGLDPGEYSLRVESFALKTTDFPLSVPAIPAKDNFQLIVNPKEDFYLNPPVLKLISLNRFNFLIICLPAPFLGWLTLFNFGLSSSILIIGGAVVSLFLLFNLNFNFLTLMSQKRKLLRKKMVRISTADGRKYSDIKTSWRGKIKMLAGEGSFQITASEMLPILVKSNSRGFVNTTLMLSESAYQTKRKNLGRENFRVKKHLDLKRVK